MLDGPALVTAGRPARALPQHIARRVAAPADDGHSHGVARRRSPRMVCAFGERRIVQILAGTRFRASPREKTTPSSLTCLGVL